MHQGAKPSATPTTTQTHQAIGGADVLGRHIRNSLSLSMFLQARDYKKKSRQRLQIYSERCKSQCTICWWIVWHRGLAERIFFCPTCLKMLPGAAYRHSLAMHQHILVCVVRCIKAPTPQPPQPQHKPTKPLEIQVPPGLSIVGLTQTQPDTHILATQGLHKKGQSMRIHLTKLQSIHTLPKKSFREKLYPDIVQPQAEKQK